MQESPCVYAGECQDKALEQKPDLHQAWYNRGVALADEKLYSEAIASYDKTLQLRPNSPPEVWNKRGTAIAQIGQFEAAIDSWDKALAIEPNDSETWYNRGLALAKLKHFEAAIASWDKTVELQPDNIEAWYNRAVALKKIGRFAEAIASYDQIIALQPDDPNLYYQKACVYALEKQAGDRKNSQEALATSTRQAIENLSKAIELNPQKYRKLCKNDSKLHTIREDVRFLALTQGRQ
ncbi:MAG: tetratricopeptide repeat protein [Microcoleus sp.]